MKHQIVFVDDNPLMHKLVSKALEDDSIDLHCYEDGLTALEEIQSLNKIDLFILDIMMPTIDGYELCRKIKMLPGYSKVNVIFVSAKAGLNNRIMGYKMGATHYLEKPFDVSELQSVVAAFLENLGGDAGEDELYIDEQKRVLSQKGEQVKLTPTEFRIFIKLFHSKAGFVTRNDALAVLPMRKNKSSSSRSLDTHISSLRKKLALLSLEIKLTYGAGYSLVKLNKKKRNSA